MRAVVQRVSTCEVAGDGSTLAAIGEGLLVYVGVAPDDGEADVRYVADKIANLRIFPDEEGKMGRSVVERGGEVVVVSQFTLFGDARKGRRPSFDGAAPGDRARRLYEELLDGIRAFGVRPQSGSFGASMKVASVNLGPVTILLDSKRLF